MRQDGQNDLTAKPMSSFALYLRTGLRFVPRVTNGDIELKFNPWHDPEDGRFTFVGQGRYFGRGGDGFKGGGGGSFGGGGATARDVWPNPTIKQTTKPKVAAKLPIATPTSRLRDNVKPSQIPKPALPRNQRDPGDRKLASEASRSGSIAEHPGVVIRAEQKNGYSFEIDVIERTQRASGILSRGNSEGRSKRNQMEAGALDRLSGDDGGHFIGLRFNGPRDKFNHFAQELGFNRGSYRSLEDDWAKHIDAGRSVFVDIVPQYDGASRRAYDLKVRWTVNGKEFYRTFQNPKKEK